MVSRITSRKNPLVRQAAALADSAGRRREERRFFCEGARLCEEAARSEIAIEACFFTEKAREKYGKYLEAVQQRSGALYLVEEHVAGLLSGTKTSQGVFCLCAWPQGLRDFPTGGCPAKRPCVVLENIQDPGNLGTVLRTAEALGIEQVVLLGSCCDPLSPKALRASMGAVFRLRLFLAESAEPLCSFLREAGYSLWAAVPGREAVPVTNLDFSGMLPAIFIGNEGNGLTAGTIALCGQKVTIPMTGRAESLNASAASTILLWEMRRNGTG